ncbi:MAG: hypothetical protein FVQ83_02835 [Chloroflexi bacterium]|nr:hypothetical protein [Chloroflexota bacterium]
METKLGKVTHFFGKINVAVLELSGKLNVGDEIHVMGHSTDFTQKIASMQIDHKEVETAKKGSDVALKVDERVREGDEIFKVE